MQNPTRTQPTSIIASGGIASSTARVMRLLATILATALMTLSIISFRPLQPTGDQLNTGGDALNQMGYGSLGALALLGLFTLVDRRVLVGLLSPWWLLLFLFLALSVAIAPSSGDAIRGALFTLVCILIMVAALTLPRDADSFSTMLACSALVVLALNYFGVLVMPGTAIHGAGGLEPQHAGLWRGSFSHKNAAGPVMACISFMGLYLWRRGWLCSGGLIFVLALFFLAHTGSKTTLGTVPLAIFVVMLPSICGMRFLAVVFLLVVLIGTALATLGIVFFQPLHNLQEAFLPGLTYTGRTTLWAFMGEMLVQRPWTGYGFASFWSTDVVRLSDHPFDRAWDVRGIIHGHNGYMDLAITMGLPALFVAICAFILAPLRDFLNVPLLKENVLRADLFLMMVTFLLLNAFLESFFFHRADPVWLLLVFALLGLRLTARLAIPAHAPLMEGIRR